MSQAEGNGLRDDASTTEPPPKPARRGGGVLCAAACLAIIALAAGVRVRAGLDQLWLDEIWSYNFVALMTSPLDVITYIHHDNSHPLNTLFMYLLGQRDNWVVYRVPAIVAGALAVGVAALIGLRRSRLDAVTAALLVGGSHVLIHYCSEARGYGPLILFALLAFYFMQLYLDERRWTAVPFVIVVILGFLSHLTFAFMYAAVLVWSLSRFADDRRGWMRPMLHALVCHALPIAFCVLLYVIHIRNMMLGGGPQYGLMSIVVKSAAMPFGASGEGAAALLAGGLGLLFLGGGLALLHGEPGRVWLFYALVILGPAAVVILRPGAFLVQRYFLVSLVFFLLLFSHALTRLCSRGAAGKALYAATIVLFLTGNGLAVARAFEHGRGDYLGALRYMAEHSRRAVVTVGSDFDFRNQTVFDFYVPHVGGNKRFIYYDREHWPRRGADWLITHSIDASIEPPETVEYTDGVRYVFAERFRHSSLSGFDWFVYRRAK